MLRLHLRDNEAHLQAPVAEVNVADDVVAEEAVDALDGLSDDGASQVSDVQGLGDVRPAVVNDDGSGTLVRLHAKVLGQIHFRNVLRKKFARQPEIQKAGVHSLDAFKHRSARQLLFNRARDLDGRFVIDLGRGQRAVALVLAEVGAVRERDLAVGGVEARFLECAGNLPGNQINQNVHIHTPFVLAIAHRLYQYTKSNRKSTVRKRAFRTKRALL